ncbi:hypothetical protein PT277_08565 [Acetobacteraceae bacterium ESL0709]|nr:hypothetical protein [Acetobacteraceae bacterium ESL0697]MDF7678735.1 hypothetical protein [Acetobacteraceae bacterium ESL0709]
MKLSRFCSAVAIMAAMTGGAALAAAPQPHNAGESQGMTGKDCRKAFFAAKKDGTLNGLEYKDFKATKCGTGASANAKTEEAKEAPKAEAKKPEAKTPSSGNTVTEAKTPVVSGSVVFPDKVDPQFASLTPGKARMKTCVAQYNANKENGGNGSLKWIQKGGGYWSQCNAHLKGGQAE